MHTISDDTGTFACLTVQSESRFRRVHSRQCPEGLHIKTTANQNTYQLTQMSFFTHANYCSRFVLICRDFLFLKLLPRQSNTVAQQATRTCSERTEQRKHKKKKTCSGCRKKQRKNKDKSPYFLNIRHFWQKKFSEVITSACFIAPLNKSRPSPGYILTQCIPC